MSVSVPEIFAHMPERYVPGSVKAPVSWYFSVGPDRYTVYLTPESCRVEPGKQQADHVLKIHPDVFRKLVLDGKRPSTLDIARGRIKVSDPSALMGLAGCFRGLRAD